VQEVYGDYRSQEVIQKPGKEGGTAEAMKLLS